MEDLGKTLLTLGFKRILIADDTPANLEAARGLEKLFPDIKFDFFASGKEITEVIQNEPDNIGLVLTDLRMETPEAGLDVYAEAWERCIPAAVVSGGYKHGDDELVRVSNIHHQSSRVIRTDKSVTETWGEALKMVAHSCSANSPTCLSALVLYRNTMRQANESPRLDRYWAGFARRLAQHQMEVQ